MFQLNTDNQPEQPAETKNELVVVGMNGIDYCDFDKDENVVVANGNAFVDGFGETEVLLLLSPKQITQLYHFCKMEQHKQEWEKTMR